MKLLEDFFGQIGRYSPCSEATSAKVVSFCKGGGTALYIGCEITTLLKIREAGFDVKALASDSPYAERVKAAGIESVKSSFFELPDDIDSYDLVWYDGTVELSSTQKRLEYLRSHCKKGCILVLRTLSWLIEPSPDTKKYCKARFGEVLPFDQVLRLAKDEGFKIVDFYISPKTDWTVNYYTPLLKLSEEYLASQDVQESVAIGISKLRKEAEVFELHCEEYSYVYYILKG